MSKRTKILILLGSARKKSANAGLVREIQKFPINTKHQLELIVLPLEKIPMFNEDQENKIPLCEEILNLRNSALEAKAIIFVTPQINGSISPLILNAFIWLSRSYDEKIGSPLNFKKAGIISASFLSENHIVDCRQMANACNMNIFQPFHLPLGNKSVNQQGKIIDSAQVGRLSNWYIKFVEFVQRKEKR